MGIADSLLYWLGIRFPSPVDRKGLAFFFVAALIPHQGKAHFSNHDLGREKLRTPNWPAKGNP
jgi:hypothetical protein